MCSINGELDVTCANIFTAFILVRERLKGVAVGGIGRRRMNNCHSLFVSWRVVYPPALSSSHLTDG